MKYHLKHVLALTLFVFTMTLSAQTKSNLPYYEIPEDSKIYTAGTVVGRAIDGLGFRFYWATEGLSAVDLDFKINTEIRSTLEIMTHIYGLSTILRDAALKVPHVNETLKRPLTYTELRAQTLNNLKTASDILKGANDLKPFDMIFKGPNGERTVPFWNAINGPIEDSIWHCGQIVTIRRVSGNPISSNINHFTGKVKSDF